MKISRTTLVALGVVIFAATVWLYWPCVHGDFLADWNDADYLQQAVRLKGLTWNAVTWAFTETQPYYHPLPRLSHVLDYQLWGKNAAGHHATSVIVHALNASLVFGFLWTLLGAASLTTGERLAMALGVAVVFAIHPLQVESVAWMSGRTQLLCTTFGIGCVWAYVVNARRPVVWGLYVAALLCKPMAVSLPLVMLAVDYYPLRRYERSGWRPLLQEKTVLIALAMVVAEVTMITEFMEEGLVLSLEKCPLSQRVLLMFQSLVFYPWKLVWPEHFSPYYPLHSALGLLQWPVPVSASVLSVGIITGLVVWARRRLPALVAGWGAYVMLVLPVSGLMPTGQQSVALRYAYMTILPLLLLAGGGVVWVWRRSKTVAHIALIGLLGCELWFSGLRTRSLIPIWHDDETLWRAVVVQFPDMKANWTRAAALLAQARAREALEQAQQEAETAPQLSRAHSAEAHVNLGIALLMQGRVPEAIGHFEEALRLEPDSAEAHDNLGIALAQAGRVPDAMNHWEEALRLKPDDVKAHMNLGNALQGQGRVPEAIDQYEQALKLRPDFTAAKDALARLRAVQTGR